MGSASTAITQRDFKWTSHLKKGLGVSWDGNARFLRKSNLIQVISAGLTKRFKGKFDYPDFPFKVAMALKSFGIAKKEMPIAIAMVECRLSRCKAGIFIKYFVDGPSPYERYDYGPKCLTLIDTSKATELIDAGKKPFLTALQKFKKSL